ncbi:MAG: hypothetical protein K6C08_15215 [Oscillospiraceae bacterium]|nr:hypothetical protein [Oscillospiraceae bacterium]
MHLNSDSAASLVQLLLIIIFIVIAVKNSKRGKKKTSAGNSKAGMASKGNKAPPEKKRQKVFFHSQEDHTHDRYSEFRIAAETPDEHYQHQIQSFLQAGLIDKKEAEVLWSNYLRSKQQ